MNPEKLIQRLSADLKPVQVVKFGLKENLLALLVGLFSVMAGLAVSGLRFNLSTVILTSPFIIQALLLLALAALSTLSALQMSIPNINKPKTRFIVGLNLALWFAVIIYFLLSEPSSSAGVSFACSREVFLNSLIPAGLIFFIVRRGAALNRAAVGWLSLTAGAAYGALATQFSCFVSDPIHVLFWHAVPVLVMGLFGLALGNLILKKV